MPGFDGFGPQGMGPRTGWGRGRCAGHAYNWGFGRRRNVSPKNELEALSYEEKYLEEELAAVREQKAALGAEQK